MAANERKLRYNEKAHANVIEILKGERQPALHNLFEKNNIEDAIKAYIRIMQGAGVYAKEMLACGVQILPLIKDIDTLSTVIETVNRWHMQIRTQITTLENSEYVSERRESVLLKRIFPEKEAGAVNQLAEILKNPVLWNQLVEHYDLNVNVDNDMGPFADVLMQALLQHGGEIDFESITKAVATVVKQRINNLAVEYGRDAVDVSLREQLTLAVQAQDAILVNALLGERELFLDPNIHLHLSTLSGVARAHGDPGMAGRLMAISIDVQVATQTHAGKSQPADPDAYHGGLAAPADGASINA